jgi:hypothetical protein
MTSIDETIIEKIQKLLALSTSSNEHEAALALAKAQKMLLQYNLSLEEVSTKQKPDRHYTKDTITASRRWQKLLLGTLCKFNFCELVWIRETVTLIGEAHNINAVKTMYRMIEPQLQLLALQAYQQSGSAVHPIRWKDGFFMDACHTIRMRLEQEQAALIREAEIAHTSEATHTDAASHNSHNPVMALILVRDEELKVAMKQFFPRLKTARPKRFYAEGYEAGRSAGHNVRFRQEIQ